MPLSADTLKIHVPDIDAEVVMRLSGYPLLELPDRASPLEIHKAIAQ